MRSWDQISELPILTRSVEPLPGNIPLTFAFRFISGDLYDLMRSYHVRLLTGDCKADHLQQAGRPLGRSHPTVTKYTTLHFLLVFPLCTRLELYTRKHLSWWSFSPYCFVLVLVFLLRRQGVAVAGVYRQLLYRHPQPLASGCSRCLAFGSWSRPHLRIQMRWNTNMSSLDVP